MHVLRPFQVDAENEARSLIKSGIRRILIVAPTGAGKTTIAASIIHQARSKGSRIIFAAHRKELIDQASARLDGLGLEHGIIMADHPRYAPDLPIQVASVQTIIRRQLAWKPDLLFIDEAHRARGQSYLTTLAMCGNPVTIGLTATPCRGDNRGLGGELFQAMVQCPPIKSLINLGYLVPPRLFSCPQPDLSGVSKRGGDYDLEQLNTAINTSTLIGDLVKHWRKHAAGRQTVAFAVSVSHSLAIRDQFREDGILAEHIDGTTPKDERERILADLASHKIQLVSNCAVLTEGWDCPPTSAIIIARPTLSLSLYLQMAGRVLRTHPGKTDCIILDHAGCYNRHGHILADREWTLEDDKKTAASKSLPSTDNYKVCPECSETSPLAATLCPCGYVFSAPKSLDPAEGELVEVSDTTAPIPENTRKRNYFWWMHQQCNRSKATGEPYSSAYAFAKYINQYKAKPPYSWKREFEQQYPIIVQQDKDRRRAHKHQ